MTTHASQAPLLLNPMPTTKRVADTSNGDYFPTSPYLTWALLQKETFEGAIGEFACGQGHIAEALKHCLPNPVIASDLFHRGYGRGGTDIHEILRVKGPRSIPNVITNPPYARYVINPFIETSVLLAQRKTALFMRLAALEGEKRGKLFSRLRPARVWVFSCRVTLTPNTAYHPGDLYEGKQLDGTTAYAWFVWDKDYSGPTTVDWIGPEVTEPLIEESRHLSRIIEAKAA